MPTAAKTTAVATPKKPRATAAGTAGSAAAVPKQGAPTFGTQAIHRAITILREIASHGSRGVRLVDIAKVLHLESPTAHRIVKGLMAQGMVSQDPASKLYRLGHVVYELGLAAAPHFQLKEMCHGTLDRIRQKTGDSVFLMIRSGLDAVCIDHLEGTYPIQTRALDIGGRRPLGVGAGSLALLLAFKDAECERIIELSAERYGAYGNASAERVRKAVRKSREAGYAVNDDDVLQGVSAIGFPIHIGAGQPFAAISIAAVGFRLQSPRREEMAAVLQKEIKALEKRLSAQPELWPQ